MQKKKMREELQEIQEEFACSPDLASFFCSLEKRIRYFNCYEWKNGLTKEDLEKEREIYYALMRNLDVYDLKILFYVHNLRGWIPQQFLHVLREQYQSQCNLLNFLQRTKENTDFMGRFHEITPKRKEKK